MTEKELLKKKLRANNFVKNNRTVLEVINLLRHKCIQLTAVESVLRSRDISRDEFLDCINFLTEEKYITLREIESKKVTTLADAEWDILEAKVAGRGMRLLGGEIVDKMIES